jgi:hypothetical protein
MEPVRRVASLALVLVSVLVAGCSPSCYFHDRWNDAKDIFTVSGSIGVGAKVRVGPVHFGPIVGQGTAGLRNGEVAASNGGDDSELDMLFIPIERARPLVFSLDGTMVGQSRGKDYAVLGVIPFVSTEGWNGSIPAHYYSQIEVVVGVGVMVRLGFNPGELLDFLLGWFGVDIYHDDYYAENEPPQTEIMETKGKEANRGK